MRNNRFVRLASKTCALMMSVIMAAGTVAAPVTAKKKSSITDDKTETVYVNADADGEVEKVTVSNWLRNSEGTDQLDDYTILSDVKNVKGDEDYTKNEDGTITWNSGGKDIYYQGETSQNLPVTVKISYFLDGKKMSAKEIAGKSGPVKIRFDYSNNSYERIKVKDKEYTINTPFTAVTAIIMDSDYFDNIKVENGKVINDGLRNIVVGMAMPGLEDSLKLSSVDMLKDIDIPSYVEVTADATDFQLSMTATAISNGILDEFDTTNLNDVDDLKDGIDELVDASTKLVDGSGELSEGVQTLADSFDEYSNGIDKATEGSAELSKGLKKLDKNSVKLEEGADTLKESLKTLKKGTKELNSGISEYTGGMDTLDKGISSAVKGSDTLLEGAKTLEKGVASYTESEAEIYAKLAKLNESVAAMAGKLPDPEDYTALVTALTNLNNHASQLTDAQASFKNSVDSLVSFAKAVQDLGGSLQETAGKGAIVQAKLKSVAEAAAKEAAVKASVDAANGKIAEANSAMKDNTDNANGQLKAVKDEYAGNIGNVKQAAKDAAKTAADAAAQEAVSKVNDEIKEKAVSAASSAAVDPAKAAAKKAAEDAVADVEKKAEEAASDAAKSALSRKIDDVMGILGDNVGDDVKDKVRSKLQESISVDIDTPEVSIGDVSVSVSKEDIKIDSIGNVSASVDESKIDAAAGDVLETQDVTYNNLDEVKAEDFDSLTVTLDDEALEASGITDFQTSLGNTLKKMSELPSVDEESLAGLNDMAQALNTLQNDLLTLKEASSGLTASMDSLKSAKGNFELLAKSLDTLTVYMDKLTANNKKLKKGVSEAVSGMDTLNKGLKTIQAGSSKLVNSGDKLEEGSTTLDAGAQKLVEGSQTLSVGLIQFGNGVEEASKGGKELREGMERIQAATGQVDEGIGKLNEGAGELAEGMQEFDEEGIQELADEMDDDLVDVANRIRAIKKADKNYNSYSGKAKKAKSSVKFIIETEEVGGDED